MDRLNLLRQNRRLRTIIAIAVLLIAGVALLLIEGSIPAIASRVSDGLAVALLTTGVVGLVYDSFLRQSTVEEMLSLSDISKNIHDSGIQEVGIYQRIVWDSFFEKPSGDIDILVAYGRTFAGSQAVQILRAAQAGKRQVQVCLLDPDGRHSLLEEYAESFVIMSGEGPDTADLAKRIREARKIWVDAAEELKAKGDHVHLRIEAIRALLPFTYYRVGEEMWIVINVARHGRVADGIPAIKVRKTHNPKCLFDWVMTDMGKCREEGRISLVEEVKN
jgi:hypothetical protein